MVLIRMLVCIIGSIVVAAVGVVVELVKAVVWGA